MLAIIASFKAMLKSATDQKRGSVKINVLYIRYSELVNFENYLGSKFQIITCLRRTLTMYWAACGNSILGDIIP